MTYLKNIWYVAAWDDEVAPGTLVSRRLLDEPVILFRDGEGQVRAASGVCPHRYASLSMGQLKDGIVYCGYHGLGFDGTGACVSNPFGKPSRTMKLKSYPVVEKYSAIWFWPGDPDAADPALIPDFSFNDPDEAWVAKRYLRVKAGYELEVDNILDLSHIQFLHASTLGSGGVANGEYVWKEENGTVWSNRDVYGDVMTPELSAARGIAPGAAVDRWIHVRWDAPSNLAIFGGAVPSGRPKSEALKSPTAHLFTPETATTTHYWYSHAISRAVGPEGETMAQEKADFLKIPFETEDMPMLESQQINLGERSLRDVKHGWLPGDAAGGRARAILYARIAAEAQTETLAEMAE